MFGHLVLCGFSRIILSFRDDNCVYIQPRMTKIRGLVFVMCALSLWSSLLRTGLGCELDQPPGTWSSVTFEHCGGEHEVLTLGMDKWPRKHGYHLGLCLVKLRGRASQESCFPSPNSTRKAPCELQD